MDHEWGAEREGKIERVSFFFLQWKEFFIIDGGLVILVHYDGDGDGARPLKKQFKPEVSPRFNPTQFSTRLLSL